MLMKNVSLVFLLTFLVNVQAYSQNSFSLTKNCPPSFELIQLQQQPSICRLVNLYQFYDSVQNRGVGGLHTSLPKHRDGFTP